MITLFRTASTAQQWTGWGLWLDYSTCTTTANLSICIPMCEIQLSVSPFSSALSSQHTHTHTHKNILKWHDTLCLWGQYPEHSTTKILPGAIRFWISLTTALKLCTTRPRLQATVSISSKGKVEPRHKQDHLGAARTHWSWAGHVCFPRNRATTGKDRANH